MKRVLALLPLVLLVSACEFPRKGEMPTNFAYRYDRAAIPPVYCYATLGQADCYSAPLPGQAHRLIGYVGAPPTEAGSTSGSGHSK